MVPESKLDAETKFLCGLIKLQYGRQVEPKLKSLAKQVEWAKGWPEDKEAFWNAEAFMWQHKIDQEKRTLIETELKFWSAGKNLDLGCGAYSYLPSVCLDLAPKMLNLNSRCLQKVLGDLEQPLPFKNEEFDSVTAIFVLNYVQHLSSLLAEIVRVLKSNGTAIFVLSATGVRDWPQQQEVNHYAVKGWLTVLSQQFQVRSYTKKGLNFFVCRQR